MQNIICISRFGAGQPVGQLCISTDCCRAEV